MKQQRQASEYNNDRDDDDRDPMPFSKASIGASTLNPTGSGSPGGLSREIKAGNSVMLPRYATIMPTPAISPSSENPP